jgi:hypothetical protein
MIGSNSYSSIPGRIRFMTTFIAGAWGLASAYTLFYSLLVKPDMRYFLLALFPLVAVWATIERKRWGRLALLGLSSAALGFFAANIGLTISIHFKDFQAGKLNVDKVVSTVLRGFNYQPQIAIAVLVLAAMTAYWMCLPNVRTEYERGKNATLAVAQRAIAMTVVGCWGITFLLPTGTALEQSGKKSAPVKSSKAQGKHGKSTNKTRNVRAAASRNNA